jgi:carbonic anhydrase/acetyltransferase-like protein (isoleucine patch superfamily)
MTRRHRIPFIVLFVLVLAAAAGSATAAGVAPSFVDPTATVYGTANVHLGNEVYVGPFARILAAGPSRAVHVGDESDIQDSVVVDALRGSVTLGDQAILAHGSTAKSGAEVGAQGTCPGGAAHCPSFVGFNSEVDGAIVDKDAMVLHLARVGPGVHIPSGRKVSSGRNIVRQDEVATKTEPVTEADRLFMQGVIEVNVAFAHGYAQLQAEDASNVRGINYDPGGTAFNPVRNLPSVAGVAIRNPSAPARIIGDVRFADSLSPRRIILSSLRADEGEPFVVGTIDYIGVNTTFHALEHTGMALGPNGFYGAHAIVHGGPAFDATTRSGARLQLGSSAVLFQSHVGNGVTIGSRSLVQASDLPDGTVVPDHTVVVGGSVLNRVEW